MEPDKPEESLFNLSESSSDDSDDWDGGWFSSYRPEIAHQSDKPYNCLGCKKTFRFAKDRDKHLLTHPRDKASQQPTNGDPTVPTAARSRAIKAKSLRCKICKTNFTSGKALRRHKEEHDKPFVCILCRQRFSSKPGLQYHMVAHPCTNKSSVLQCFQCNKNFSSVIKLHTHVEAKHGLNRHVKVKEKKKKKKKSKKENVTTDKETLNMQKEVDQEPGQMKKESMVSTDIQVLEMSSAQGNENSTERCIVRDVRSEGDMVIKAVVVLGKALRKKKSSKLTDYGLQQCEICDKNFSSFYSLWRHLGEVHGVHCQNALSALGLPLTLMPLISLAGKLVTNQPCIDITLPKDSNNHLGTATANARSCNAVQTISEGNIVPNDSSPASQPHLLPRYLHSMQQSYLTAECCPLTSSNGESNLPNVSSLGLNLETNVHQLQSHTSVSSKPKSLESDFSLDPGRVSQMKPVKLYSNITSPQAMPIESQAKLNPSTSAPSLSFLESLLNNGSRRIVPQPKLITPIFNLDSASSVPQLNKVESHSVTRTLRRSKAVSLVDSSDSLSESDSDFDPAGSRCNSDTDSRTSEPRYKLRKISKKSYAIKSDSDEGSANSECVSTVPVKQMESNSASPSDVPAKSKVCVTFLKLGLLATRKSNPSAVDPPLVEQYDIPQEEQPACILPDLCSVDPVQFYFSLRKIKTELLESTLAKDTTRDVDPLSIDTSSVNAAHLQLRRIKSEPLDPIETFSSEVDPLSLDSVSVDPLLSLPHMRIVKSEPPSPKKQCVKSNHTAQSSSQGLDPLSLPIPSLLQHQTMKSEPRPLKKQVCRNINPTNEALRGEFDPLCLVIVPGQSNPCLPTIKAEPLSTVKPNHRTSAITTDTFENEPVVRDVKSVLIKNNHVTQRPNVRDPLELDAQSLDAIPVNPLMIKPELHPIKSDMESDPLYIPPQDRMTCFKAETTSSADTICPPKLMLHSSIVSASARTEDSIPTLETSRDGQKDGQGAMNLNVLDDGATTLRALTSRPTRRGCPASRKKSNQMSSKSTESSKRINELKLGSQVVTSALTGSSLNKQRSSVPRVRFGVKSYDSSCKSTAANVNRPVKSCEVNSLQSRRSLRSSRVSLETTGKCDAWVAEAKKTYLEPGRELIVLLKRVDQV